MVAALALTGCADSSVNSVENAQKTGQRSIIVDKRITTDHDLSRGVAVIAVNTAMTPGNVLKVQVEFQNKTRHLKRFIYTFEWFDFNGMQINNALSASIPDQIEAGESKFVSAVAPTPACGDFRLKLISAK